MAEATATGMPTASGRVTGHPGELLELTLEGGSYRLHLAWAGAAPTPETGQRLHGVIKARARRIDVVQAGGRYIEPVFGRPRRVQGRITGGDPTHNLIYVLAGAPVVITPTAPGQQAADFLIGQLVSFDVERGATLEPTP